MRIRPALDKASSRINLRDPELPCYHYPTLSPSLTPAMRNGIYVYLSCRRWGKQRRRIFHETRHNSLLQLTAMVRETVEQKNCKVIVKSLSLESVTLSIWHSVGVSIIGESIHLTAPRPLTGKSLAVRPSPSPALGPT